MTSGPLLVSLDAGNLRLAWGAVETVKRVVFLPGLLDIGERGRLLSLEIDLQGCAPAEVGAAIGESGPFTEGLQSGRLALDVVTPEVGELIRTTPLQVGVELDASGTAVGLLVPRRGEGYEITYPTGNR